MTMRRSAVVLLLVFVVLTCSACRTIRTHDVGKVGVEDAMRFYMTNPTVVEWLRKTKATPILLEQGTWKIILSDGVVFYNEYSDDKGVLYINQIHATSDDPQTAERIKQLNKEIDELFRSKQ
jgi:hypothetical protein